MVYTDAYENIPYEHENGNVEIQHRLIWRKQNILTQKKILYLYYYIIIIIIIIVNRLSPVVTREIIKYNIIYLFILFYILYFIF